MALFGLFGGGDAQQPATEQPREHTTSADLFASTNFSQSAGQQQPQPGSSFIPDPPAAGPSTPQAAAPQLPSALDTFSSAYDPAKLHPLAGLGQNLDFLQLDEDKLTDVEGAASVLPSRGWTDDLCVGTGTTYVSGGFIGGATIDDARRSGRVLGRFLPFPDTILTSGLAIGGAWGFKEGWSRQLGENASGKLRLNSILNGSTRRGTLLGNSLGVLAIFYNLTNSSLDAIRGKHDFLNSMGAAALSGAVFKSTAGLKPAAISAGVMAGAAGAWSAFKGFV